MATKRKSKKRKKSLTKIPPFKTFWSQQTFPFYDGNRLEYEIKQKNNQPEFTGRMRLAPAADQR